MSRWMSARLKSTRGIFGNWSPVIKLIKRQFLLSKQVTVIIQLYSVALIPTKMGDNMKVIGCIPKHMAIWDSISFLSIQQSLAKLSSREKG